MFWSIISFQIDLIHQFIEIFKHLLRVKLAAAWVVVHIAWV